MISKAIYNMCDNVKCKEKKSRIQWNIDLLRDLVISRGYKRLITEVYIDNHQKIEYECNKGHVVKVVCKDFIAGCGCPECFKNSRYNMEYITPFYEIEGFKVKPNQVYKNNKTKVELECPIGHDCAISFSQFNKGHRCGKCNGNAKFDYEEVRIYIESVPGHKLKSKEYKGARKKILIECPEGHDFEVTFAHFKENSRCPFCSKYRKKETSEIKDYLKIDDYTLLESEYISAHVKMKMRCPCDHEFKMSWANYKAGYRCKKCFLNRMSGENHPLWNFNRDDVSQHREIQSLAAPTKRSFRKIHNRIGDRTVHVDHINSVKTLVDLGIRDSNIINCHENYQFLSIKENCSKGSKSSVEDAIFYLISKGVDISELNIPEEYKNGK